MRIYCYYKLRMNPNVPGHDLYAWTENKEYATLFESTRYMKNFRKRTIEYEDTDLEIRKFRQDYSSMMLIKIPLFTQFPPGDTDNIEIVGTYEEDSTLSTAIEYLASELEELEHYTKVFLKNGWIKPSFAKKVFKYIRYADKNEPTVVNVDSYRMFFNLFQETFLSYQEIQKIKKESD